MQILLDENQELREELERLRQMSYNDRVKESGAENQVLRRRNGELLIKNSELMDEIERLKKEAPLNAPKVQQPVFVRPQTAQSRPLESFSNDTMEEVDKELTDLLSANQKRIHELHQDLKQVSKITDEPYINVRKVRAAPR